MRTVLEYLKNLSRPWLILIVATTVCVLSGLAVVLFVIQPLRERGASMSSEVDDLQRMLARMKAEIKKTEEQAKATAQVRAERDAVLASGTIEPYLGSIWMGAKSLMSPLAQKTGFTLASVKDYPTFLLRLPSPVPEQLYARQPIELVGRGSFEQIVRFIQEVEETCPLTILSGLVILSQPQTPECHKAIMTFEWPVKHEWLPSGPAGQK